ncbi:MAG TPA: restriction endonuclease subunit S [Bacteroidales bacterium]|nr:restriction endonuclease subunit S [Bacteroidales bacterium]
MPESWEWETIKDISNSIQYGYTGKALSQGKYKMLRITDIQNNCVNWDSVPYVKIDEDKAEDYLLYDGDILFARTGATVGKSFLIVDLNEKSVFASYLIRIKPNKNINTKYIKFFLESNFYWEQISKNSVGTGQPNVNGTILGELRISIPPLSEQNRIVAEIERLFKFINTIEENKFSIEEYFSLMKSKVLDLAIRGKLIAQDPNDEPASVLLERIGKGKKVTSDKTNCPFELPNSWEVTEMQNICSLLDGEKRNALPLPYLDVKFLRNQSGINLKKSGKFVSAETNLILVDGENSGEIFKTKVDGYQGSTLKIIQISNEINEEYIFYILKKEHKLFKESKTGSAIPHLNKKLFREYPIPLSPLAEQQRIVDKIEEIFIVLEQIKDNLLSDT